MQKEIMRKKSLYYPTIFISDIHLGKGLAMAAELLEFLSHIETDEINLVGDIFDGWFLEDNKHKKWPEMEMRVLDALNAFSSNGTKINYIVGNHDESLRRSWSTKHKTVKKNDDEKRRRHRFINNTYKFTGPITESGQTQAQFTIKGALNYKSPSNQNYLTLHGDQFDEAMQNKRIKRLAEALDPGYDLLIKIDRSLKTKFATWAKKNAKKTVGEFTKAVSDGVKKGTLQGVICGHSHEPKILKDNKLHYYNTGDWVESASVLVEHQGELELINWIDKRLELGLKSLPKKTDPNPNKEFRPITQRQLRWAQRIWPAKNHDKLIKKMKKHDRSTEKGYAKYEEKRQAFLPY